MHRTDDKINKAIHRMLFIILELAKKDTYNSNQLDLDTYEGPVGRPAIL